MQYQVYGQNFKSVIPKEVPNSAPPQLYHSSKIRQVNDLEKIDTDIIFVDSRFRNWDRYDNNDYTIALNQTFKYVHSIKLIGGYVPRSGYVIQKTNNCIYYQENNDELITGYIPPGNYTIKKLLRTIGEIMTNQSTNHYIYNCSLDQQTQHVTITCNHNFNLIFTDGDEITDESGFMETRNFNPLTGKEETSTVVTGERRQKYISNSIGKNLGFKPINLTHRRQYTGQIAYDLDSPKYLVLYLNSENDSDFKKINSIGPDGSFAIIPMTRTATFDCYSNKSKNKCDSLIDDEHFIKHFNPPINLSRLKIQFRTPDGSLYDFNGIDHYLIFEIRRVFGHESITHLQDLK